MMESELPESKRPRLSAVWPSNGPPSLPTPGNFHHSQQSYPPRSLDQLPPPASAAPVPLQQPGLDDGRRHETDSYVPVSDHHPRPPPTPIHSLPYPTSFSLREPVIKRDPAEDPVGVRRTLSASESIPDGVPPPTPGVASAPPQSPYPDDSRRLVPIEAMSQPPGPYRTINYPPPMHHSQYEPATFSSQSNDSLYYQTTVSNAKRKATRASQACESCRQLKAKCDETKPCKTCKEKGFKCLFRDPIMKAGDKAQADILDGINDVKILLKSFASEMEQVKQRMYKMEEALQQVHPNFYAKTYDDARAREFRPHSADGLADDRFDPNHDSQHDPRQDENGDGQPTPDEEDELEGEPGPPVAPGDPAMPINHTTLASLLLEWPSIREMAGPLLEKEKIKHVSEYPIRQEKSRGLIRVYGRGEGHDSRQSRDDHGVIDTGDDVSDIASPAADWGLLGSGPVDFKGTGGAGAGYGSETNPDFSPETVRSLIKSFRDNILILHPIIMPNELETLVQCFLDSLPPKSTKTISTPTFAKGFAVQSPVDSVSGKRKRSPSPDSRISTTSASMKPVKPLRTITNCVVLLAMALGKICQFKECVPDVVHTNSWSSGSPVIRNGVPASPTQPSPPSNPSRSHSSGLPSPNEFARRRSSHGGLMGKSPGMQKKNYEAIPGLEYHALATDIIGNQLGGTSMKHVWAGILAGLYLGQLGRPMESYAYISNGSKILQIIMRPHLDRLRTIREKAPNEVIDEIYDNKIAFAFWTCLQLESDILAELPLPHSGILAYEDCIPYPNLAMVADTYDTRIFESYMAQLYLRRHLNSIHKMFYHPKAEVELNSSEGDYSDMKVVQDRVGTMEWVPPAFYFNETDEPAEDILSARLRAKYWGAQVITHRPFIKQILQFTHYLRRKLGDDISLEHYKELNPRVILYAERGIKGLIESTRAFHNLGPDRPIITNVFGTAHAQWGNMLVLAAVFQDPFLNQFMSAELLQMLFSKTITFLKRSSTESCNLRRDMRILIGVEKHVFRNIPKNISADPPSFTMQGGLSLHNPLPDMGSLSLPPPPLPPLSHHHQQ